MRMQAGFFLHIIFWHLLFNISPQRDLFVVDWRKIYRNINNNTKDPVYIQELAFFQILEPYIPKQFKSDEQQRTEKYRTFIRLTTSKE